MADNFTFKNASGSTLTVRAADNSSVYLPGTFLATSAGVEATDDSSGGPIFPIAGVYQATVDEVDANDVGRVRMTIRRALVTQTETRFQLLNTTAAAADYGDLTVSTNIITSFAAPTAVFCDGSDAGFGAAARYIRVPFQPGSPPTITVLQTLAVNVDVAVYMDMQPSNGFSSTFLSLLATAKTVATLQQVTFTPDTLATGAVSSLVSIPMLRSACRFFVVSITPASDPSAGNLYVTVSR